MALHACFEFSSFRKQKKKTQLMTISTETVRMAKSRLRKNQSERSDLPCHIIMLQYLLFKTVTDCYIYLITSLRRGHGHTLPLCLMP